MLRCVVWPWGSLLASIRESCRFQRNLREHSEQTCSECEMALAAL